MNQRNVELHICGTGNDDAVNEMKRMAEICGIASKCHWHGNVSHDKILKMMASSDLMFFTSIMEATSTVVLEAITVGLPILCFNTCGFGPIVKKILQVLQLNYLILINQFKILLMNFHYYIKTELS